MSGPRQVSRIAHKARRLVGREGYGERGRSRKKRRDLDARWFCVRCGKWAYRSAASAEAIRDLHAVDDPRPERLNVYECVTQRGYWHVGHSA